MGRVGIYTPELANEIVSRLAKGEPLAAICRDEHMPDVSTVSRWRKANTEFDAAFLGARDAGFDEIATQCMDIADDASEDFIEGMEVTPGTKAVAFNPEHVQRSKLRVETRLKLLAKWDPRRYGDLQKIEHSGEVTTTTLAARMRKRRDGPSPEGVEDLV